MGKIIIKRVLINILKAIGIMLLILFWILMWGNGEGPRGSNRHYLDVNGVYQ
jgi:hypothetical protein